MVSIQVDEERIRELAYQISQEPKSWDDLVWLLAEAELRLRPALALGKLYQDGDETRTVKLEPKRIVDDPSEDDIRALAEEISKQGPSPQDLHWLIAERRYVYEEARNA